MAADPPERADFARQTFNAFWHGPPLSPYEALALTSFVARGHRVVLHRYDPTLAVPDGVETADAAAILPTDTVLAYRDGPGKGSFALHANLFRLALLAQTGGWYVDLDVVLLAAAPPTAPLYMAWEDVESRFVSNAILRAPAGQDFIRETLDRARAMAAGSVWAESGPILLTEILRKHGLLGAARPAQEAFPLHWTELAQFFLPQARERVEARLARSHFVHFWHEQMRRCLIPATLAPPEGSWFDARFREFGIVFPTDARLPAEMVERWIEHYERGAAQKVQPEQGEITRLRQQLRVHEVETLALHAEREQLHREIATLAPKVEAGEATLREQRMARAQEAAILRREAEHRRDAIEALNLERQRLLKEAADLRDGEQRLRAELDLVRRRLAELEASPLHRFKRSLKNLIKPI